MAREGEKLELRNEPGGWRHYLEGEPVHCGRGIEVRLQDGTWLRGAYEASWKNGKPDALLVFSVFCAGLKVDRELGADGSASATMQLYESMKCRWPERGTVVTVTGRRTPQPAWRTAWEREKHWARRYDEWVSKLQIVDRHESSPTLVRFFLRQPDRGEYASEVVTLKYGCLLVHGDVDMVLFSNFHRPTHWRQVLEWMGTDNASYAQEKASIGGTKDTEVFDVDVARAGILEYRRQRCLTREHARELWDRAYEGEHEFQQYAEPGVLDAHLGRCIGPRVLMAQAVLRRLLVLLDAETQPTEAACHSSS